MINQKFFDNLAQELSALIPTPLQSLREEVEHNFKVSLQAIFAKLDLVTREEFDIQVKLLEKARERITDLEQQLKTHERKESI